MTQTQSRTIRTVTLSLLLVFLCVPLVAQAQIGGAPAPRPDAVEPPTFENPLGETNTIGQVLVNIIRWLLGITGALALLAIIWSGIQFIISIGNEQQLQRAKKSLMWAIIGLVVIFLAFVIVELIFTSLTGRAPTP